MSQIMFINPQHKLIFQRRTEKSSSFSRGMWKQLLVTNCRYSSLYSESQTPGGGIWRKTHFGVEGVLKMPLSCMTEHLIVTCHTLHLWQRCLFLVWWLLSSKAVAKPCTRWVLFPLIFKSFTKTIHHTCHSKQVAQMNLSLKAQLAEVQTVIHAPSSKIQKRQQDLPGVYEK